jgi:hypothetical protein
MNNILLSTSTASSPTGLPTQKKLFRVPKGAFTGRLIALNARTAANLAFTFADAPVTSWSAPANFVTESDDLPFDAVMDDDGNIHVAYTQTGTGALRVVKLAYLNGTWTPQTAVTIYDSATSSNKYPSIIPDAYDRIWVAWTRDDAGTITLRAKSSTDDGATWGGGATDPGTDLSGSVSSVYARLISRPTHLHCLYTVGSTEARHRKINLDAALWDAADVLYTGTGLGTDITGAVAPDGKLGALFVADAKLSLKEFDGATWGAIQTVVNQPCFAPSLRYIGLTPYALFLQNIGTDQNRAYESHGSGASFTVPSPLLTHQSPFASLFCYDADAPTPYADLTTQAASTPGADIAHPTSGGLIKSVGDAIYLGGDDRFSFVRILLSQNGAGGTVIWSYWNGNEWNAFTPASGAYDLSAANKGVRLFTDGNSTPTDWQKSVVNGAKRYWIRILCTTAFSTAPIGSQVTAVSESTALNLSF